MKSELWCRHVITKWVEFTRGGYVWKRHIVQPLAVIHEAWVITR
jgi:hypothetical protein